MILDDEKKKKKGSRKKVEVNPSQNYESGYDGLDVPTRGSSYSKAKDVARQKAEVDEKTPFEELHPKHHKRKQKLLRMMREIEEDKYPHLRF